MLLLALLFIVSAAYAGLLGRFGSADWLRWNATRPDAQTTDSYYTTT